LARILITGGAGYVGSHCAKALADAGHKCVVFDSLVNGHTEFVLGLPREQQAGLILEELVHQLPDGTDTILGERSVRLSGGQRQRVALARAFYHGRSVLVMDEATSALDNETEREIVEEIRRLKGQKTLIVIAHRVTTVQYCDRIYRLQDGAMVEQGTYDRVIRQGKGAASAALPDAKASGQPAFKSV
jgi:ABC-type protease/lipase transport system fused ATPase/permease subunit